MTHNLSATVGDHIERLFEIKEQAEAIRLVLQIHQTGSGGQALNRCEIAALKISDGSLNKLKWAVDLYHVDFRDLLMSAGFGHDTGAHTRWTK